MTRTITGVLTVTALAAALVMAVPGAARGPRGGHGGGFFGRPHHGHPINSWMGSRRLRLR